VTDNPPPEPTSQRECQLHVCAYANFIHPPQHTSTTKQHKIQLPSHYTTAQPTTRHLHNFQRPTSNSTTSGISISNIRHPTSDIQHPTSDMLHQPSTTYFEHCNYHNSAFYSTKRRGHSSNHTPRPSSNDGTTQLTFLPLHSTFIVKTVVTVTKRPTVCLN